MIILWTAFDMRNVRKLPEANTRKRGLHVRARKTWGRDYYGGMEASDLMLCISNLQGILGSNGENGCRG